MFGDNLICLETLLQIDPRQRPTIHTLVENIEDLAIGNDIGLNEPLTFLFNTNDTSKSTSAVTSAAVGNTSTSKKSQLRSQNLFRLVSPKVSMVIENNPSASSTVSSHIPSSIKGLNMSGKSWMKNFINSSTRVINDGVQQVKQ